MSNSHPVSKTAAVNKNNGRIGKPPKPFITQGAPAEFAKPAKIFLSVFIGSGSSLHPDGDPAGRGRPRSGVTDVAVHRRPRSSLFGLGVGPHLPLRGGLPALPLHLRLAAGK